jgi:putative FmdB family regulatory protein
MPNYEFQCNACQHAWDALLPISARNAPLDEPCPQCSKIGSVARRWDTPPETGADAALKPQSGFARRMEAISKHHGRFKPHVRENISRALDGRVKRYGRQ